MPDTFAIMICNVCGKIERYAPDITVEEIQEDPRASVESVKTYYKDAGWKTSWGHDICPDCQ